MTTSGQVRASGTIATYRSTRFELFKVVVVAVAAADAVLMQLRELNPTHTAELDSHLLMCFQNLFTLFSCVFMYLLSYTSPIANIVWIVMIVMMARWV